MSKNPQVVRMRDFSGGEAVEHAKRRDDEAVVRASARTLRNVRILSTGAVEQRPGRAAKFQESGRADKVRMSPDYEVYLCFGNGTLTIRNSTGTVVARAWGYSWATATVDDIRWARFNNDIIICFSGQVPKIARWDGGTEWIFLDWAATVTSGGRKLVPFYRLARAGITMALSALTGSVTVTLSENYFTANHVGTRFRYYDRQLTITAVTNGTTATATINEQLRVITSTDFTDTVTDQFAVGDIITGETSGARRYVMEVGTPGTDDLTLLRLDSILTGADTMVGPQGQATVSSLNANPTAGPALVIWDEEVFNATKGWPRSVTVDQGRLIFSDFPGLPDGIAWSRLGDPTDLYPAGELATDAIFETVPNKARVLHVMEGADEFVITDRGIYYIPISETNPLQPGSIAFRRIPGSAGSAVRPVSTGQGVVYVNAGLNRVLAITPTGQTAMPWAIRSASDLHSHLFAGVTCLAIEEGNGDPPDELVYAVNADGTVAVGRYEPGKEWVGWLLWEGEGEVKWASALGGEVLFSTSYDAGYLIEEIDPDQYLDAAVIYDAIPAALGTGAQADILLPDDQGTNGGNMTAAGGVAAARNGTTAQSAATSASRTGSTDSFWFVKFGQAMKIAKVEVWPSNDSGFASVTPVTVSARGVTGSTDPTLGSEGSEIATTGSIADTTSMQTLTSSDEATEFTYLIIRIQSASGNHFLGEVRPYSPGLTHGSGELWYLANESVDIMDGRRVVGTGVVDGNGEVTASSTITNQELGFGFDVTIEPFIPHVQGGQSVDQTLHERQIGNGAVAVQNSTGFKVQSYKPNSAAWTTTYTRPAHIDNEDEDSEPAVREETRNFKVIGADHDPRVRILKDYPGPLRVLEIGVKIDA